MPEKEVVQECIEELYTEEHCTGKTGEIYRSYRSYW
jgi:hypothetical protein